MPEIPLNVVVSPEYQHDILAVSQNLHAAGFKVEQTLDIIGIITGTGDRDKLDEFARIDGIQAIEEGQEYQLAPPESNIH